MKYLRKITKDILYVGASDLRLDLFENLFPLDHGVSYNSYLILDKKTCLLDTVDSSVRDVFLDNVKTGLNGRGLDYLVINHLEPDHSAVIFDIVRAYPKVTLVLNVKSADMLRKFLTEDIVYHCLVIKENDELDLGNHCLTFVMAPMVHWPEVMVSYDKTNQILFSADAFGTFGALSGNIFNDEIIIDESFYSEARRYYTNIVGKFGMPVQTLLKKASSLDIRMVCPLHGPIWRSNLSEFIHRYQLWSSYESETNEIVIIYGSMYDNTYHACVDVANRLADQGIYNIKMFDVSKTDISYLISEIFRVRNIVLACPTYNGGLYPKMHNLITDMLALNVSNKNIGLMENGTWASTASKKMKELLSGLKNVFFLEHEIKIDTVLKSNDEEAIQAFVLELCSLAKKD